MNNGFSINIGTVKLVEGKNTKDGYDGLRIRVYVNFIDGKEDKNPNEYPWAFPLLPKVFQSVPKVGEAVFVFMKDASSQRYYLGPIISQPQYFGECITKNATTLLENQNPERKPIERISNVDETRGSFPNKEDVAVVGRGKEDIILKYANETSEIDLRAGIRVEPTNSSDPNIIGNVIFNDTDPAYIQLKYKKGLATSQKNKANSVINMVANRINIMSNKDEDIAHNLKDKNSLVVESKMDEIMNNLHPLPKGDKLIELLNLMKGAIMNHVHPWAGMEQCGDWGGYLNALREYDVYSILSDYVRIS